MRILVKHGGDPIGTYRPIRPGEDPRQALLRAVRADYPQRSARIGTESEETAWAEWGESFSAYRITGDLED